MNFELIKYEDQFQVGLSFARHGHCSTLDKHFHIWIDLGWWCLEITFCEHMKNSADDDKIFAEIDKLREIPEDIFKPDNSNEADSLGRLGREMQDEIANALGGATSDGGYIIDGDLWESKPEEQYTFLIKLHEKYKVKSKQVKS